jgi:flagellar hook-length control protein FliK
MDKDQDKTKSQAADQTKSPSGTGQNNPAAPSQALSDLMAFLQALPGGALTIAPEQVPKVASMLANAGLPQAEVDQLLTANSSGDVTLTAANLQAAWQRVQGQGVAGAAAPGLSQTQAAAQAGAGQTQESKEAQATQEILQNPNYRNLWERLSLPQSMVPTLRLALTRMGASPEALAKLEEGTAAGQGIPLTQVWGMLQNVNHNQGQAGASSQGESAPAASPSQSAILGQQTVMDTELKEWQQMLLNAGLPPEVVQKLVIQTSPDTQEQLRTRLLSLAPTEDGPTVLADPKPLYLPNNLRMRPLFWESPGSTGQNQGQPQGQTQEQAQGEAFLNGNGVQNNGANPAPQLTTLPGAPSPDGTMALPPFSDLLQGAAQGMTGFGGPLGAGGLAWRPLTPEAQASLWTQLQSGVTANLSQGESKVTISLNPPELGQLQLTLQLNGQELAVSALASRPEVAAVANLGLQQLTQALAQQGLVLTQFQVNLQGQPTSQVTPVVASPRGKGGDTGGNPSASSRRGTSEVDRFV